MCPRHFPQSQLFAFVREFAAKDQDRLQFDQYRPYVTMMHTKAVATPLVELHQYDAAIQVIDAGIKGIRGFLAEYDQLDRADRCGELTHLERLREQLTARQPALPRPRPTRWMPSTNSEPTCTRPWPKSASKKPPASATNSAAARISADCFLHPSCLNTRKLGVVAPKRPGFPRPFDCNNSSEEVLYALSHITS